MSSLIGINGFFRPRMLGNRLLGLDERLVWLVEDNAEAEEARLEVVDDVGVEIELKYLDHQSK